MEAIDWANLVRMIVKAKAMTEASNIHNKSPGECFTGKRVDLSGTPSF